MANRTAKFELHIRPLFRALDRDHMAFFGDLWDESTFYEIDGTPKLDKIQKILDHVAADNPGDIMPLVSHGGPWPNEWKELFQRWIDEGCQKLHLAKGEYSVMSLPGGTAILSAQNVSVVEGSEVWFDRKYEGPEIFTYYLCCEPPANGAGNSVSKDAVEQIKNIPPSVEQITVIDSEGNQEVVL